MIPVSLLTRANYCTVHPQNGVDTVRIPDLFEPEVLSDGSVVRQEPMVMSKPSKKIVCWDIHFYKEVQPTLFVRLFGIEVKYREMIGSHRHLGEQLSNAVKLQVNRLNCEYANQRAGDRGLAAEDCGGGLA